MGGRRIGGIAVAAGAVVRIAVIGGAVAVRAVVCVPVIRAAFGNHRNRDGFLSILRVRGFRKVLCFLGALGLLRAFGLAGLVVDDLHRDRVPVFQVLQNLGLELFSVFLNQRLVRRVDGEGDLAAFRQEAHVDGPFNQIIRNRESVFSFIFIILQQRGAVLVDSLQPDDRALPVQIHLHLRVDGKVDGGVGGERAPVVVQADQQQEAGGDGGETAARPAQSVSLLHRLFSHQNRFAYRLPCFIMEVRRFYEPALFVQKDSVAGVAFHHYIFHHTATPFITCVRCPRMISYPLV